MTTPYNPSIAFSIPSQVIREDVAFSFNIRDAFLPNDDSLRFSLKYDAPKWLQIDPIRAEVFGMAPKVHHTKPFKITVTAENVFGSVTQSFIISVLCIDVIESMPETLELAYTLKHQKYGFSHIHPYTPSLLEYIYTLYQLPAYKQAFHNSLHEHAHVLGKTVTPQHEFSYQEFQEIVTTLNPGIDERLREHLSEDNALLHESMNNEELQKLFRQGSQQLGVIAIPVWNHLGAIDQYNWEDWQTIENVLNAASHAISRNRHVNIQNEQRHNFDTHQHSKEIQPEPRPAPTPTSNTPKLTLQLKPKDGV